MIDIDFNLITQGNEQSNFCVAIAEARDELEARLLLPFSDEFKHCIVQRVDQGLALIFTDSVFRVATAECLNAVYRIWPQMRPSPLFIAVGHTVTSAEDIVYSYETARYLLRYKFVYYEDTVINLDSLAVVPNQMKRSEEILLDIILANNRVGLRRACRDLVQHFRGEPASESDIKVDLSQRFMKLIWALERRTQDRLPEREVNQWSGQIRTAISLEQLSAVLLESYYEMTDILNERKDLPPAERVVEYLRHHYAEEITLDGLALKLNYNTAYLGRLVRQELGTSFNVLRDQVRIEEAKRLLLETTIPISEISQLIGLKDKDYFSSKFKRLVGVSPSQYRQKRGNYNT